MKLLNLNVGIKLDNSKNVINLINKDNYDIVTLQEIMKKIDNGVFDLYNSGNIIKDNTKYSYEYFGPLWFANHHEKNGVITSEYGGLTEQGNQILSIYPIIKSDNIFYYKSYSPFIDTTNFRIEDHPRAFINITLDIDGKQLQIINVHGVWSKDKLGDERIIAQSKAILSHVREDIPCIVVGDFNLLRNSDSIKMLNNKLINLIEKYDIKSTRPTFDDGLDKGNLVCDYIFINDKVKLNDFSVMNTNISDHFPLILDFDI